MRDRAAAVSALRRGHIEAWTTTKVFMIAFIYIRLLHGRVIGDH